LFDCDFIPRDHLERFKLRRAVKHRISLIGVMVILMAVWTVMHQHDLASAQAVLQDVTHQQDQMAALLARKAELDAERGRLEASQRLVDALEDRASLVVVFGDVSRRLPQTVVLTELVLEARSIAACAKAPTSQKAETLIIEPGVNPPAQTSVTCTPGSPRLTIEAIAKDAPESAQCVALLEQSPLLSRVQMESRGAVTWSGKRAEKLVITCDLVAQQGVR
jgi:Tfp pilus assembly protein PilN